MTDDTRDALLIAVAEAVKNFAKAVPKVPGTFPEAERRPGSSCGGIGEGEPEGFCWCRLSHS